jgi:hypothetical protein
VSEAVSERVSKRVSECVSMVLKVGDSVWYPHEEHSWLCATVRTLPPNDRVSERGSSAGAVLDSAVGELTCSATLFSSLELCGTHVKDDIANLVDLDELSEVRE